MVSTYHVAWWNVENLFDEERSPRRTDKVIRAVGDRLQGWTAALRDRKIEQLASVIVRMNGGAGPDLLGVCEVENQHVVELLAAAVNRRLTRRGYRIVHADTRDQRGIDIAFLYDPALLTAPEDQRFQHVVMRRTATREIFQVNFTTHRGRTWAVFGNHWPSRNGGQAETAGYRAIAGETLAYFHQRVGEVHGRDTPALAMGDFNDEPFDPSLVHHALSTRERARVLLDPDPRLWNMMWPVLGARAGTFYYGDFALVLDQFLVNRAMVPGDGSGTGRPIQVVADSVEVVVLPGMAAAGPYPKPVPFGGMGRPVNRDGYSDHFPIALRVVEQP